MTLVRIMVAITANNAAANDLISLVSYFVAPFVSETLMVGDIDLYGDHVKLRTKTDNQD